MTDDDIKNWKIERDIARESGKPELIQKAYDHRDDLMMNCIQHQADRCKALIDRQQNTDNAIKSIQQDVEGIKLVVNEHSITVNEVKENRVKGKGVLIALKILGYISATFGSGAVGWILALSNKVNGIQ